MAPTEPGSANDALESLRARVEALRASIDQPPAPPIGDSAEAASVPGLESLVERVRNQVAARRAGVSESADEPIELPELAPEQLSLPRFTPPRRRLEPRSEYMLGEIVSADDAEFLHNAYTALLGRDPEPSGFSYHLARLESGQLSQVALLDQIAASPEGRKRSVIVRGLSRARALERAGRWPIVGPLIARARQVFNLTITVRRLELQERRLRQVERELRHGLDTLAEAQEGLASRLSNGAVTVTGALAAAIVRLDRDKAPRATTHALTRRIAALRLELLQDREGLRRFAERRELYSLLDAAQAAIRALSARMPAEPPQPALDDFYVEFENSFRGDREDIKGRAEVYLPIVEPCVGETGTVLDIGCGRGEWLELLAERGVRARGIDMNAAMVAQCRALGLDVVQGDAVDYLASQPADFLEAITGMHVIEHMPFGKLVRLLDESLRVLRPGGVAIFETPNPENLIVGACNFWSDPTHERPLPPQPMRRTLELRGYAPVQIMRLHPFPSEMHLSDSGGSLRDQLNHLLYGEQDYAVVAYKPREAPRQ